MTFASPKRGPRRSAPRQRSAKPGRIHEALIIAPQRRGEGGRARRGPERSSHFVHVLEPGGEYLDAIETPSNHGGPGEAP